MYIKVFVGIILILLLQGCEIKPEEIHYGEDQCAYCKMNIMDSKFGGEFVTTKGKIYKFDDVNCLMSFVNSPEVTSRDMKYTLVTDFSQPEKLIDATIAFYVKSPEIKSPMASQVAAFETEEAYKQHKKELNGIYLTWGELTAQFK